MENRQFCQSVTCATEGIECNMAGLTLGHVRHDERECRIHRRVTDEIALSNIVFLDQMTCSIADLQERDGR